MSVWDVARQGGRSGGRHALGLWDPRHRLASLAWMPPVSQRRQIYGKKRFCYVRNFPLATANNVLNDRVSITSDFWWTDIVASYPPGLGAAQPFTVQMFDTKNNVRYMQAPEDGRLWCGVGRDIDALMPTTLNTFFFPYFFRRITKVPAGSQLLITVQDSSGLANNTVQLVLGGYID